MILQNPIPGMIFESDGSARDIFADPLQMSQAGMPSFLEMLQNCKNLLLTFDKVQNPLRLPRKTTSERPKVVRDPQFLTLLTSKCASRHNGVHFFNISVSKSAPNLVCFARFDFEIQNWSEHEVLCTC